MVQEREWSPAAVEAYCLGLIAEEAGEALQWIGKGMRFGMDLRRNAHADDHMTARDGLTVELGDVLAAIEFAILHGVLDGPAILAQKQKKIRKLTDAMARDNLGRQLAPPLKGEG